MKECFLIKEGFYSSKRHLQQYWRADNWRLPAVLFIYYVTILKMEVNVSLD